ncbi:MAG TPA: type II toxin-antitoxin system HicA family toxin [Solirubrobacteraceae bacterium]|nr:type II toxin-antitoxin system HicA family toxin [Solirubrobacteraceae bacterium]
MDSRGGELWRIRRCRRRGAARRGLCQRCGGPSHSAPSFRVIKVREIIKVIEAAGWRQVRQKGSHRQFRHPVRRGTVTVAGHPRDDLLEKTAASIMRQAGLRR